MKKNQNGVTLIALAVTIIVMLILAGATMSMLTGNSGIMTNAKKSSAASEGADAYEKMAQAFSTVQLSVESEAALNGGYDASEAAELTKYAQMAQKEIGTAQAIIEDSAKTTADLKANISKYNKRFVIWVDSSATQKKIYMVYYSKTFALDPVTTSVTTVSTKNEYPMLKASIDFDTNVVTYTKPVTSVVDANRVTSTR